MSLSEKLNGALNQQLMRELEAEQFYLSLCAYFESLDLKGFAQYFRQQSEEEHVHAMKFFDFVNERSGRVELYDLKKPKHEWESPLDAAEYFLASEQEVTQAINGLVKQAREEHDYATETFLQWFITEQVEEEDKASYLISQLELIGESKEGLYHLDKELGAGNENQAE